MSPWLIHFPDVAEPYVVMDFSGREPKPGEVVIAGWVVDRKAPPGPDGPSDYALEIWVKPSIAA
jgi:hypothetical protein